MTAFISTLGIATPFVAALFGALLLRRTEKEKNSLNQWKELFDAHKVWTTERLAERDERIDDLSAHVDRIETKFDALERKYRVALSFIQSLLSILRSKIPDKEMPKLPESIASDL